MICPYCNSEIRDGLKFCPKCGSQLAEASYQQPEQPQYQEQYQPQYQEQQYQNPQQQYVQPPVQVYVTNEKKRIPGKGLGIASMVLGIVAFAFSCTWYISLPLGLTSLILAIVGKIKAKSAGSKNGFATAGIICSIFAIAWIIILLLGVGSLIGLTGAGVFAESL